MKEFDQFYINNSIVGNQDVQCTVELFEKGPLGEKVAEIASCSGALKFDNPKPWWPYLMTDEEPGNF
jgi:hypothetical protein